MQTLKTLLKISLKIAISIVLLILIAIFILSSLHEDMSQFDDEFVESLPLDQGDVSVRFMGNTNLLFSDGNTSVLIDGWFSRPSLLSLALSDIEPDLTAIDNAFERAEIRDIDVIATVHSHYDHAMDSPEVAKRTGAILLGSESTANIGRGWGLVEEQILVAQNDTPYRFGEFTITMIPSSHFEFPNAQLNEATHGDIYITEPLTPPAKVSDYKMGGAYSVYIQHPKGNVLVQGSAGFIPNSLNDLDVDIAFLGVGGLNSQTAEYQNAYWQHSVMAVNPELIYPVHWDSLTDELADKPHMPDLLISNLLKFSSRVTLEQTFDAAAKAEIEIGLLPMWQPIKLF